MALTLSSSAFSAGGSIPAAYTCDGQDKSPPLSWDGVPAGTRSFALIVDDPDAPDPKAPKRVWVHWVLYNLSADTRQLAEAVTKLPPGARDGKNDGGEPGYGGPCPPIGLHRYFFKLYALDQMLPDLGTPTKAELEKVMQGHVLEKVEIIGTYERPTKR
jgi:Raf kinase inhibitor-like YbhB/YbcL family protein